jgi:hypothetical protein
MEGYPHQLRAFHIVIFFSSGFNVVGVTVVDVVAVVNVVAPNVIFVT